MSNYEDIFKWLKQATKQERHMEEMESFAKRHPILFMKFHQLSGVIVKKEETSSDYQKAKTQLEALFIKEQTTFMPLLQVIREKMINKSLD